MMEEEQSENGLKEMWENLDGETFGRLIQNIGVTRQLVRLHYLCESIRIFWEREWKLAGLGPLRFCFLQLISSYS